MASLDAASTAETNTKSQAVTIEVSENNLRDAIATAAIQDRYAFLTSSRRSEADTDYTKMAKSQGWLPHRTDLFIRCTKVLEEAHLAKLTQQGMERLSHNLRHSLALLSLHTSRATERLRCIFAEIGWHVEDAPWLNAALLDNLDRDLAEEYIDVLRHLRLKCPVIMEARGLLDGRGSRRLNGSAALKAAIATPLAPIPLDTPEPKYEFKDQLIIILAPGEHSWNSSLLSGWKERLNSLGKVVSCHPNETCSREIPTLARNLLRKVRDTKQKYPHRPLVLLGMSVGAKVAIMVSFKERVNCLVCLGLQLQGIAGNDAVAVDTRDLFQLRPPTIFAIGSQSRLCPVSLMEQVRLQMIARNKLVIIRDADENLRIPLSKRLKVKLTQTMSDQLVMHEIGTFINDSLKRTVRFSVELGQGKVVPLEAMPSDTVASLKAKIKQLASGFKHDQYNLVFNGKSLVDLSTLAENSVSQDSRLEISHKIPASQSPSTSVSPAKKRRIVDATETPDSPKTK